MFNIEVVIVKSVQWKDFSGIFCKIIFRNSFFAEQLRAVATGAKLKLFYNGFYWPWIHIFLLFCWFTPSWYIFIVSTLHEIPESNTTKNQYFWVKTSNKYLCFLKWVRVGSRVMKNFLKENFILCALSTNNVVQQPVYRRQRFHVMDVQCNGLLEIVKKLKLIFQILNIN